MRWFDLIRWFGWLGVAFSNSHVSITRISLPHANIISLQPQGWLSRAVKPSSVQSSSSPVQSGSRIREVVYVASHLTLHPEELDDDDCLSDHHFCSLLCDRGFTVHIVRPKVRARMKAHETEAGSVAAVSLEYMEAISHVVRSRINEHRVPATAICLIATELSAPRLLTYLAEVALPMTSQRANIGSVVLIDPPPLLTLLSPGGSSRVIKRYTDSLRSAAAYRQLVCPYLPLKPATRLWKRLYQHYWGGQSSVGKSLLAAMKSTDSQLQRDGRRDIMQFPGDSHSPPQQLSVREHDISTRNQSDEGLLNPHIQQGQPLPDPAPDPDPDPADTLLQQYVLDQELRLLARDAAEDQDDPWARRLRSVRSRRLRGGALDGALGGALGGAGESGSGGSGGSGDSGGSGGSSGANDASGRSVGDSERSLRLLSPAALVGTFPPKASLVASALPNRILVVSTAAAADLPLQSLRQPPATPSPYDALVESFAQHRDSDSDNVEGREGTDTAGDGGSGWGLEMTVDRTSDGKDEWGLEATLEVAHLYQAGPVIELCSDDDDDDDDEEEEDEEDDADSGSGNGGVTGGIIPGKRLAGDGGSVGVMSCEDVSSDCDEANDAANDEVNGLTWRELEVELRASPPPPKKSATSQPVDGLPRVRERVRVLSRKQRQKMQSASYRQLLVSRGWTYTRVGIDGSGGGGGGGGGGVGGVDGWGGEWSGDGDGGRTRSDGRSRDVAESGNDALDSATVADLDRGEESDDDEMDDLVWSLTAIRRHRQLARVVTDWWDMLPVFGYL